MFFQAFANRSPDPCWSLNNELTNPYPKNQAFKKIGNTGLWCLPLFEDYRASHILSASSPRRLNPKRLCECRKSESSTKCSRLSYSSRPEDQFRSRWFLMMHKESKPLCHELLNSNKLFVPPTEPSRSPGSFAGELARFDVMITYCLCRKEDSLLLLLECQFLIQSISPLTPHWLCGE